MKNKTETKHDVTTLPKLTSPKLRSNVTAGRAFYDPDGDPWAPPVRPVGDPAV